jgi:hypothetical protein
VTVTILNADKRIGTHVFVTVARNDAGQGSNLGWRRERNWDRTFST